jgi:hypothetical protein
MKFVSQALAIVVCSGLSSARPLQGKNSKGHEKEVLSFASGVPAQMRERHEKEKT